MRRSQSFTRSSRRVSSQELGYSCSVGPADPSCRCSTHHQLTQCFDDYETGDERFAKHPNEGRIAELEALHGFLQEAVAALDAEKQKIVAPLDRMKQLLQAKDKRTMLLEMAGTASLSITLCVKLCSNYEGHSSCWHRLHTPMRRYAMSRQTPTTFY